MGVLGYKYDKKLQENQAQLEQANWNQQFEIQAQENRDLIADERAYNSPEAQLARLQAAGINPTFGNGGMIANGNTDVAQTGFSPAASIGNPGTSFGNISPSDIMGSLDTAFSMDAKVDEMRARAEKQRKEGAAIATRTPSEVDKNIADIKHLSKLDDLTENQRQELDARVASLRQEANVNREKIGLLRAQVDYYNAAAWADRKNAESGATRAKADVIQANAMSQNAKTNAEQLEFEKERFSKDFSMREEQLRKDYEKMSADAFLQTVKNAEVSVFGVKPGIVNRDAMREQMAILSAMTSYVDSAPTEKYMDSSFLEAVKLIDKMVRHIQVVVSAQSGLPSKKSDPVLKGYEYNTDINPNFGQLARPLR